MKREDIISIVFIQPINTLSDNILYRIAKES